MKPVHVQTSTYIDFGKENNYKDFKFKVSTMQEYWNMKYIFAKACTPIWSEEMLVVKEVENALPWT